MNDLEAFHVPLPGFLLRPVTECDTLRLLTGYRLLCCFECVRERERARSAQTQTQPRSFTFRFVARARVLHHPWPGGLVSAGRPGLIAVTPGCFHRCAESARESVLVKVIKAHVCGLSRCFRYSAHCTGPRPRPRFLQRSLTPRCRLRLPLSRAVQVIPAQPLREVKKFKKSEQGMGTAYHRFGSS